MVDHNIIAHGPTTPRGGGLLARRTVVRDLSGPGLTNYVVHTQCFHEDGRTSFCNGYYFVGKPGEDPAVLKGEALSFFKGRI